MVPLKNGNFTTLRHRHLYYLIGDRIRGDFYVPVIAVSADHSIDHGNLVFV